MLCFVSEWFVHVLSCLLPASLRKRDCLSYLYDTWSSRHNILTMMGLVNIHCVEFYDNYDFRNRYAKFIYFLTVKYSHNYMIQLHSGFSMSRCYWLLLLQVVFPILLGTGPFSKATVIYLCRKYHSCIFLCKLPVTTVGSWGPLPWLCGFSL